MTSVFLLFSAWKWLENCCSEFKSVFYRKFVDDIFVLFESAVRLSKCYAYFNTCYLGSRNGPRDWKSTKRKRSLRPLCRIMQIFPGRDGVIRIVNVKTLDN